MPTFTIEIPCRISPTDDGWQGGSAFNIRIDIDATNQRDAFVKFTDALRLMIERGEGLLIIK